MQENWILTLCFRAPLQMQKSPLKPCFTDIIWIWEHVLLLAGDQPRIFSCCSLQQNWAHGAVFLASETIYNIFYIDMTELCNWAKSIAKWTPRLDRPHNPNLIVPQRWLCKMGIMPPCSCKMSVEKNLTIFVNSLNPELWVCFLPWPRRESELFQADAQLSCPARNDLLLVLLQENIAVGSWRELSWASSHITC